MSQQLARYTLGPYVCAVVSLLTVVHGVAQDEEASMYTRFAAGLNLVDTVEVKQFYFPTAGQTETMDSGFRVDLVEGGHLTRWLDIEFNTGFIYNSFADLDGQLMHVPLLINLVAQWPNRTHFVPYVGGGAGGALTMVHWNHAQMMTTGGWVIADGFDWTWTFAYQAMAGIRWTPADSGYISLGYQFLGITAPSFTDGLLKLGDLHNHAFVVGFCFEY